MYYRNTIPVSHSLSLLDDSTVSNLENHIPKVEDMEKGNFPLILTLFEKAVQLVIYIKQFISFDLLETEEPLKDALQ